MKQIAMLIYPGFSNYEIAFVGYMAACIGRKIELVAKTLDPVENEDGFRFLPNHTLETFNIEAYDCLVLSGIGGDVPAVVADDDYTAFLRRFKDRPDYTIASISISPLLLAKAGLLEGKKHCIAINQEDIPMFPFLNLDNIVYAPIVVDGNIITAQDTGFREFVIAIAARLGYTCREDWFGKLTPPYAPERFTYRSSEGWQSPFMPVK